MRLPLLVFPFTGGDTVTVLFTKSVPHNAGDSLMSAKRGLSVVGVESGLPRQHKR